MSLRAKLVQEMKCRSGYYINYGFLSSRIIIEKHWGGGKLKHGDVKQWRTQGNIACF